MSTVAKFFVLAGLLVIAFNVNGAAVFGLILVAIGFLVPGVQPSEPSTARIEALEQYIRKLHRWIVEREAARAAGDPAPASASAPISPVVSPDAPETTAAQPVHPMIVRLDVPPERSSEPALDSEVTSGLQEIRTVDESIAQAVEEREYIEASVPATEPEATVAEEERTVADGRQEAATLADTQTAGVESSEPFEPEPAGIAEDVPVLTPDAQEPASDTASLEEETAPESTDAQPDREPLAFPQPESEVPETDEEDTEPETAAAAFSPVTPQGDRAISPRTATPRAPRPEPVPRRSFFDFEQILGTNWLAKVGVAILVIGVSFFLAWQLRELGPAGKVTVGAIVGFVMLGTGIWFERNERYRVLARAVLGGGWALLFFVSWAAHHMAATRIVDSPVTALALMLVVAGGMVAHTLRYRSQVVTGLAFVLAFSTVAVNQADVFGLTANIVLALGFSAVIVRMRWFPLEIVGIAAAYLNHYLWLHPIVLPDSGSVDSVASAGVSVTILLLYWAIFRASFVIRRAPDEKTSVIAGLLNSGLLLVVLRGHPASAETAFRLLLALGIVELVLSRLPLLRNRRDSFIALTTLGTMFITAAIPLRFAPGSVTIAWLVNAIVLSFVGVLTHERVYRRLGTLVAVATAFQLVAFPLGSLIVHGVDHAPATAPRSVGIIAMAVAAWLLIEATLLVRRWRELYPEPIEQYLVRALGYVAVAIALPAGWLLFPHTGTAVFWGVAAIVLGWLGRRTGNSDLAMHATLFGSASVVRSLGYNFGIEGSPLDPASRTITVAAVALLLYGLARIQRGGSDLGQRIGHIVGLWAGTVLLAMLAAHEVPSLALALTWGAFAFAIAAIGRHFDSRHLTIQANLLTAVAVTWLLAENFPSDAIAFASVQLSWRAVNTAALVALLYALTRWNATGHLATPNRIASIIPSWAAAVLLALLAAHEVPALQLVLAWTALAFALALAGRRFDLPHLTVQSNVLAAVAVTWLLTRNFPDDALALESAQLTWRAISTAALVAFLYLLTRWNATGHLATPNRIASIIPSWVAAALLALLVFSEMPEAARGLGWSLLGFALAFAGHKFRNGHLMAQANGIAMVTTAWMFAAGFASGARLTEAPLQVTWRTASTVGVVALLYILSRWNAAWKDVVHSVGMTAPRVFANVLLMVLLWHELEVPAVAVGWALLGSALLVTALRAKLFDLVVQANLVAAAAAIRVVVINLPSNALASSEPWPLSWRILASLLVVGLLYALARWNGDALRDARESSSFAGEWRRFAPSVTQWGGTALLVLLAWYELVPAAVAVAWTLIATVLLEVGLRRGSRSLTIQAHALFLLIFGRVFVVNMNIDDFGAIGARVFTVVPIAAALVYAYWRGEEERARSLAPRWFAPLLAWLGIGCVTALLRFQLAADAVVTGWAALTLGLMAFAAISGRRIFAHIAIAVTVMTLARGALHNLYERSYFPSAGALDRWLWIGAAAGLLFASLAFAFRLRTDAPIEGKGVRRALRWLDARPEQLLFFAPLLLVTTLIGVEMRSGMLTVAWGLEGVIVFVVALLVGERSYRLSGLALLLLCVGKIFALDFWALGLRDKALTGIVIGLALIGVSILYSRKRETILKYL